MKASENKAEDVESKSLKLSVKDRLNFNGLFPQQDNILGQIMARDINEKTQITQTEIKSIDLKPGPGGGLQWKAEKAKDKTIEFTGAELEFLRTQVARLDKAKQITSDLLELCLKIKG